MNIDDWKKHEKKSVQFNRRKNAVSSTDAISILDEKINEKIPHTFTELHRNHQLKSHVL